jgi:preprotein translocase subunit SecA
MNKQRSIVYELRGTVLSGDAETVHRTILEVFRDLVEAQAEAHLSNAKTPGIADFMDWLYGTFPVSIQASEIETFAGDAEKATDYVFGKVKEAYEAKCAQEDQAVLPAMERGVFLNAIDRQWQDYLRAMDDLRQGVGLRSYGQRDPLVEYKREAFDMFERLIESIKNQVANNEFRATTAQNFRRMMELAQAAAKNAKDNHAEVEMEPKEPAPSAPRQLQSEEPPDASAQRSATEADLRRMLGASGPRPMRNSAKLLNPDGSEPGRNDPCPCGSGKKYKKCHGA